MKGPRRISMMENLVPRAERGAVAAGATRFLDTLHASPRGQWRTLLLEHIRENLVTVMGLPAERRLDPRQGLTALGLDSLMALELKTRLNASLGLQLPS